MLTQDTEVPADFDIEAFMAESVEAAFGDDDFDNTGTVAELADGTSMSYDDWVASDRPQADGDTSEADAADALSYEATDMIDWSAHRKGTVGIADMIHVSDAIIG